MVYTPKFYIRVDGIPASDCRNLKDKFGPDFPALIAANPSILAKTRYSKEKRDIIVKACQRGIKARKKDTAYTADLIAKLNACGVTKAKARRLAAVYDATKSPYQFFFRSGLTFLQSDHVAKLIDPERAARDRAFLLIIDQFVDKKQTHIIISQREIFETVWTNFGVDCPDTSPALNLLIELGGVRKIERKGLAPASIKVGEHVHSKAFGHGVIISTLGLATIEVGARVVSKTFGGGVIVSATKSGPATVKFDDGEYRSMHPRYLQANRPPLVNFDDGTHRSM